VRTRIRAAIDRLARIGVRDTDTDDARVRKEALTLAAVIISLLGIAWVGTYAALGLWLSAAIPFAYQLASVAGLVFLARTGRDRGVGASQLTMMLLLPFLLQWSLGGFTESSAVAFWALGAPFGALVFYGTRESVPWFAGFLALLGASALLDSVLPTEADIPSALVVAFFALNIGGTSLAIFFVLQYFVRARDRTRALLRIEQERSERLLLNVLPASIAERLKSQGGVIAERHGEVTVLFADLAGFTPAAERLPPDRVVTLLDGIFSRFDELVASHGLEKIKTIGDGYMVAGGIPSPRTDHAEAIADLALNMLEAVEESAPENLALRVGIDTGPVVAGVIGRSKFGYDLWGDTVNTASRMESHAPPGGIQVTERTYERVAGRYRFERRDGVEIKGKGLMTTYLLRGRAETLRGEEAERTTVAAAGAPRNP
jgi:adenylate cyclase